MDVNFAELYHLDNQNLWREARPQDSGAYDPARWSEMRQLQEEGIKEATEMQGVAYSNANLLDTGTKYAYDEEIDGERARKTQEEYSLAANDVIARLQRGEISTAEANSMVNKLSSDFIARKNSGDIFMQMKRKDYIDRKRVELSGQRTKENPNGIADRDLADAAQVLRDITNRTKALADKNAMYNPDNDTYVGYCPSPDIKEKLDTRAQSADRYFKATMTESNTLEILSSDQAGAEIVGLLGKDWENYVRWKDQARKPDINDPNSCWDKNGVKPLFNLTTTYDKTTGMYRTRAKLNMELPREWRQRMLGQLAYLDYAHEDGRVMPPPNEGRGRGSEDPPPVTPEAQISYIETPISIGEMVGSALPHGDLGYVPDIDSGNAISFGASFNNNYVTPTITKHKDKDGNEFVRLRGGQMQAFLRADKGDIMGAERALPPDGGIVKNRLYPYEELVKKFSEITLDEITLDGKVASSLLITNRKEEFNKEVARKPSTWTNAVLSSVDFIVNNYVYASKKGPAKLFENNNLSKDALFALQRAYTKDNIAAMLEEGHGDNAGYWTVLLEDGRTAKLNISTDAMPSEKDVIEILFDARTRYTLRVLTRDGLDLHLMCPPDEYVWASDDNNYEATAYLIGDGVLNDVDFLTDVQRIGYNNPNDPQTATSRWYNNEVFSNEYWEKTDASGNKRKKPVNFDKTRGCLLGMMAKVKEAKALAQAHYADNIRKSNISTVMMTRSTDPEVKHVASCGEPLAATLFLTTVTRESGRVEVQTLQNIQIIDPSNNKIVCSRTAYKEDGLDEEIYSTNFFLEDIMSELSKVVDSTSGEYRTLRISNIGTRGGVNNDIALDSTVVVSKKQSGEWNEETDKVTYRFRINADWGTRLITALHNKFDEASRTEEGKKSRYVLEGLQVLRSSQERFAVWSHQYTMTARPLELQGENANTEAVMYSTSIHTGSISAAVARNYEQQILVDPNHTIRGSGKTKYEINMAVARYTPVLNMSGDVTKHISQYAGIFLRALPSNGGVDPNNPHRFIPLAFLKLITPAGMSFEEYLDNNPNVSFDDLSNSIARKMVERFGSDPRFSHLNISSRLIQGALQNHFKTTSLLHQLIQAGCFADDKEVGDLTPIVADGLHNAMFYGSADGWAYTIKFYRKGIDKNSVPPSYDPKFIDWSRSEMGFKFSKR